MKRLVCIKILRPELVASEFGLKRFQREVRAVSQLAHPNIVTAFDADESSGIHFLVMEYVEGQDLGTLVSRSGPLPVAKAMDYMLQAARGLEYAHSRGIVHRDIKPGNLLLDPSGTIKISDMGLARFDNLQEGDDSVSDHLTRENQIVGTVEYMAPEQAEDSTRVDRRSDIYSLGCALYRLVTGRPPYDGENAFQVLLAQRTAPIPSMVDVLGAAIAPLDAVYQKMVAKDPAQRYQWMGEVMKELARLAGLSDSDLYNLGPTSTASSAATVAPTKTLEVDRESKRATRTKDLRRRKSALDGPSSSSRASRSSTTGALPPAVGVDLGTTFSLVARLDDQGRPVTIANSEGDLLTPSVVLFDGENVVVGKEAVKAMSLEIDAVADSPKRELGQRLFNKAILGKQFPPEVLLAYVLDKLRRDTRRVIGDFRHVVITVPAYFDEIRRKATQDAGYMAGFEVLDIINEPTAAALAFAFQHGYLQPESADRRPERLLVYDLGGGTFDVTIMEIRGTEFVALATDGDVQLGGRDWDQRLVDYVAEQFLRAYGVDPREDPQVASRLWRECEDAKRTLSVRQKAQIQCNYRDQAFRVDVSRQLFEEITHDLLERTAFTVRHTLQIAGLEWSDIDRVLLVGGSTRMPTVAQLIRDLSGRDPEHAVAPDEAVAHGAALHAGLLLVRNQGRTPTFSVRNVNSHSLGIVANDRRSGMLQNVIVIPRNTPLPAVQQRVFKTHKQGQSSILVRIVEGESTNPNECAQIGRCSVRGLPSDLPAQTPIMVRFSYAENGRLSVSVRVGKKGKRIRQEITREISLSQPQLDEWRKRIAGSDSLEPDAVE